MKACPTKAIRVRGGKATRVGTRCIDCGECIRVCPKGAIKAVTTWSGKAELSPYSVVGASPVLYAQFGNEVMPNDILLALRKIFNYVYDQAYAHELYSAVTELYIKGNRGKEEARLASDFSCVSGGEPADSPAISLPVETPPSLYTPKGDCSPGDEETVQAKEDLR